MTVDLRKAAASLKRPRDRVGQVWAGMTFEDESDLSVCVRSEPSLQNAQPGRPKRLVRMIHFWLNLETGEVDRLSEWDSVNFENIPGRTRLL